ncbi:5042_t:CDS:2 [Funneliformis geosporum]|uniref:5042_t:CDS:1 n=1 Tax=Funneliformis geosporum TaxID=1117311 RepID=A0A9W4T005_9GLOM|nr:5042_t:CDS:2 [Funneliformis geosporum]
MKFNLKGIAILFITFAIGISAISTNVNIVDGDEHFHYIKEIHKREVFQTDYFQPFVHYPFTDKPVTRFYNFTLKKVKLSPDGFERTVWSVNGQYPGPIIRANKGDQIVVNVTNNLGDPATVHWHGMYQRETNWYDGVPGQTQCPIPNGVSMVYNFSTGEQHGTYWYHSHFMAQYLEEDPYLKQYDYEYAVTLSEWHHRTTGVLLPLYDAPNYAGFRPIPDSPLISGRGRYNCTAAPAGSSCKPNAQLAKYNVKKNKKYRFHIINSSGDAFFVFSIDKHKLKVIEVEGEYVRPTIIEKLPIYIGQRYSVIVDADQPAGNYWIRGTLDKSCNPINNSTINFDSAIDWRGLGILHYEEATNSDEPTSVESTQNYRACRDLDQTSLQPLQPKTQYDKPVTDFFNITVRFQRNDDGVFRALMNESSYVSQINDPTNHKITLKFPPEDLPKEQNSLILNNEKGVVELVLMNNNPGLHTFHMHGHSFAVVFVGEKGDFPDPSKYNTKNPIVRDTVTVPEFGYLVIRFIADNPGIWSFHCHIEWHVEIGMVLQLIELPSIFKQKVIPEDVISLCMEFDYEKKKKRSHTDPTLPAPYQVFKRKPNPVKINEIRSYIK